MTLNEYMERKGLSPEEFGKLIGRSRTVVYRYTKGTRTPRPAVMQKIAEVTGGKVRLTDWVGA
jgi:transcriptional regulator with XRE-family HTH domain